jgi:hypothetical protein
MADLKGKTLFITGASRGIGLAIALKCARDGANIAIAAKTAEPHPKLPGTIHTAAEEIEKAGGKALPLVVDVRDEAQVAAGVAKRSRFRRHRCLHQQRVCHPADRHARHRHEALRPDAVGQRPRQLHGVEILPAPPARAPRPAYPHAVAAALPSSPSGSGRIWPIPWPSSP